MSDLQRLIVPDSIAEAFRLPDDVRNYVDYFVYDGNKLEPSLLVVKEGTSIETLENDLGDIMVKKYLRPYPNSFDLNSDASFRRNLRISKDRSGLGVVAFDDGGELIGTYRGSSVTITGNDNAELEAAGKAVNMATELKKRLPPRYVKVTIGIDNYKVVRSIHNQIHNPDPSENLGQPEEVDNETLIPYPELEDETVEHGSEFVTVEPKHVRPGVRIMNNIKKQFQEGWDLTTCVFYVLAREINFPADYLSRVVYEKDKEFYCYKGEDEGVELDACLMGLVFRTLHGWFPWYGAKYGFKQEKKRVLRTMSDKW